MKQIIFNSGPQHVIHFENWPMDCLVNYLRKRQALLTAEARKIITEMATLIIHRRTSVIWLRELNDLFTSFVNRQVIQMARQDQHLVPCLNHVMIAIERKLPCRVQSLSLVIDCIDRIKQDYEVQKKIFSLIRRAIEDSRSEDPASFYPDLFKSLCLFEKEWFHLVDLLQKIFFPKILRILSRL